MLCTAYKTMHSCAGRLTLTGAPLSLLPAPLQKCPFDAIMIINLPKDLESQTTHRYGPNTFKLHRRAP